MFYSFFFWNSDAVFMNIKDILGTQHWQHSLSSCAVYNGILWNMQWDKNTEPNKFFLQSAAFLHARNLTLANTSLYNGKPVNYLKKLIDKWSADPAFLGNNLDNTAQHLVQMNLKGPPLPWWVYFNGWFFLLWKIFLLYLTGISIGVTCIHYPLSFPSDSL